MPLIAALFALTAWKNYGLGGVRLDLPEMPVRISDEGGQKTWLVREDSDAKVATLTVAAIGTDDVPVATLAATAQGAAEGYRGRLVEQRDLLLNGWPGIEGKFESNEIPSGWVRAYRVKDQLFVVISMMDATVNERIFGSLAFAARFGRGPQSQAGPIWKRAALGDFSVELPDAPSVESDRLTGAFGNRTYVMLVSKDEPRKANEAARKAAGAKTLQHDPAILGDYASERLEASAFDGKMAFLAESVTLNGKTVTLTALVPNALKTSPEVRRFFTSLKVG